MKNMDNAFELPGIKSFTVVIIFRAWWDETFEIFTLLKIVRYFTVRFRPSEIFPIHIDTLSKWIKSVADVLKRWIRRLNHSVNTMFSDNIPVSMRILS